MIATVVGALVVGVFTFAVVGFNVLRSDIASTERLARIEAIRTPHAHTHAQP